VVQPSPFRFPRLLGQFARGVQTGLTTRFLERFTTVPPTPDRECRAEWVSFASAILRSSMLEEIGLLDEGLYTYFDDVDLCLRATRAGWETWYVPASRVVHLEGAATGITKREVKRRPAYWYHARRRFFLKSYGPAYAAATDASYLAGLALRRLKQGILGGEADGDPPHLLEDSIRHGVFGAGFRVEEVENPAMPRASPPKA
jgi:GT2 family glycosyltransferase